MLEAVTDAKADSILPGCQTGVHKLIGNRVVQDSECLSSKMSPNLAIFCTLLAKIELTKKLKLAQFCLSHPDTKVSSVAQLCLILCNLMDCSTPGFPVHH